VITSKEKLTIFEAVGILAASGSNMLQFQVFKDKEQRRPVFAAFFVLGEKGEPKEAIKEMTRLKKVWEEKNRIPSVIDKGSMEVTYVLQQIDTEGSYDISRKCDTSAEFLQLMRQCGIKKLDDNQRIVKRIEVPVDVSSLKKN
jgi:hypothetical protein